MDEPFYKLFPKKQNTSVSDWIVFVTLMDGLSEALMPDHLAGCHHHHLTPHSFLIDSPLEKIKVSTAVSDTFNPLHYAAPEIKSPKLVIADGRADLYSLGGIFFELYHHHPPFLADDDGCMVLLSPDFPETIAAIIEKCLNRDPEDRYQTLSGLRADLQRCLTQLERDGMISNWALGEADCVGQLRKTTKLFGRDTEISRLITAVQSAANGESPILTLTGPSGSGKTALVERGLMHCPQARWILRTKSVSESNRPFSMISDLIEEAKSLIAEYGVVYDDAPSLDSILPPLLKAMSTPSQIRPLASGLRKLLEAILQVMTPLICFFDDLQWADEASLRVLVEVMIDEPIDHSMWVFGFRSLDAIPAEKQTTWVAQIQSHRQVDAITTAPLNPEATHQLVSCLLGDPRTQTENLSEIIYGRSKGLPLYIEQFLNACVDQKRVRYDSHRREWIWKLAEITQMPYADDIADLLTTTIQTLPQEARQLLQLAATIGYEFEVHLVAQLSDLSETKTRSILDAIADRGLVARVPRADRSGLASHYRFLHDRFRQIAYQHLASQTQATYHRQIGDLLCQTAQPSEAVLFSCIHHLAQGDPQPDPENRAKIALCQTAAKLAQAKVDPTTAYEAANLGLILMGDRGDPYDDWFELRLLGAEALDMLQRKDEFLEWIEALFKHAKSEDDTHRIIRLQLDRAIARSDHAQAVTVGRELLRRLGFNLKPAPSLVRLAVDWVRMSLYTFQKTPETLIQMKPIQSEKAKQILDVMATLIVPVVIGNFSRRFRAHLFLNAIRLAFQYGGSEASSVAFTLYGSMMIWTGQYEKAYAYGKLATLLNPIQQNSKFSPVIYFFGHLNLRCVREPTAQLIENADQYIEQFQSESNSAICTLLRMYANVVMPVFLGHNRQAISSAATKLETQLQGHQSAYILPFLWQIQKVTVSLESEEKLAKFQKSIDLKSQFNTLGFIRYANILNQAIILFSQNRYQESLAKFEEYGVHLRSTRAYYPITHFCFYSIICMCQIYSTATQVQKYKFRFTIQRRGWHLKRLAGLSPPNCQDRWMLAQAEIFRIRNQSVQATMLYDVAIAEAKKSNRLDIAGLANELSAQHFVEIGKVELAKSRLTDAMNWYDQWGAKEKIRRLTQFSDQLVVR